MRLFLSLAVACGGSAGENEKTVRGVAPGHFSNYDSGASPVFHCLLSTSSATVPWGAVNDDFCDCEDGSDEPGTAACAGQKRSTMFYCPNQQSAPSYIYSSRVNDGVCDCCDGSDEWRKERCKNSCYEEGRKLKKEADNVEYQWKHGLKKKHGYIAAAEQEKQRREEQLAKLRADIPSMEAEETKAKETLKAAELALEAERLAAVANASGNISSNAVKNETANVTEEASLQPTEQASTETSVGDNPAPPAGEQEKVVSEYTKWMEGAESALGDAGEVKKSVAVFEEDEDDEDVTFTTTLVSAKKPGLLARIKSWFARVFSRRKPLSPAEAARDAARLAADTAERKLKEARQQQADLTKKLDGALSADRIAFSALDGKCLSKKITEYTYEICFFKNAKQGSTSVGNWKGWLDDGAAHFEGGARCPGGPDRSLKVVFVCGYSEGIEDISEPSRCAYQATVVHPAACAEEPPDGMGRTRMPIDEL